MRFGLDYAWTTISPAAHRAVGSSFACRYLSHDPRKNLGRAELSSLHAGGIDVVTVWETIAYRALDGHNAGVDDAREAHGQAQALGIPGDRPIYFAVDFDETPDQAPRVLDYFRGAGSVLGVARTGVYGGLWVVRRLLDARAVRYAWQTYAWSGGQRDPRAQLYQFSNGHRVGGQDCDYNHAYAPDFGQWGFQPVHDTPGPAGKARALIEVDVKTERATLRPLPGPFKPGGKPHKVGYRVDLDLSDGRWNQRTVQR